MVALVCLCYGVSERRIRQEIEHGASCIAEVAARCHAGSCCHGCHPTIEGLLDEHARLDSAAAVATPRRRRHQRQLVTA